MIRRYLTLIQAAEGYPPPGVPLEAAPPDGPAEPVLHTVVMADAYEALEAKAERLQGELDEAEERYEDLLSRVGGTAP